jgi:hypothetical protein
MSACPKRDLTGLLRRKRLAALFLAGSLALIGGNAATAQAATTTFAFTGTTQTFIVPSGVTSVHAVAIGGRGGTGGQSGAAGGFGATATADIPVTAGQVLFIEVAGNGSAAVLGASGTAGFNGGGAGGASGDATLGAGGGGGGGATDIRTTPPGDAGTLGSRLIIAGGGGGGGGFAGGTGGPAGANGSNGTAGGAPGTGGTGATLTTPGTGGNPGVLGSGGAGQSSAALVAAGAGGGGGGGVFGGGGGVTGSGGGSAGGGGGGGSSGFAASANDTSVGPDTTGTPSVRLTYPGAAGSTTFAFGKLTHNKKKGTATQTVIVPLAGTLTLSGKGIVTQRPLQASSPGRLAKAVSAGKVKIKIKAKGKKKRKLNRTGKVKVKAKFTFKPTGGSASSQTKKIKLIKRLG